MRHALCPPCKDLWNRWLDAPMFRHPPKFANHAAYDDTPRGIADNRRARANDHWDLVRRQIEGIKDRCRRLHPVQATLFEVAS